MIDEIKEEEVKKEKNVEVTKANNTENEDEYFIGASKNLEPDVYESTVENICVVDGKDYKSGEPVKLLRWVFKIEDKKIHPLKEYSISKRNGIFFGSKSNNYKYYEKIMETKIGEKKFDVRNCIGKKCRVVIDARDDGSPFVKDVLNKIKISE